MSDKYPAPPSHTISSQVLAMRRRTRDTVTRLLIGPLVALTPACSTFAGPLAPGSEPPAAARRARPAGAEAVLRIDRLFGGAEVPVASEDAEEPADADPSVEALAREDVRLTLPPRLSQADLQARPLPAARPGSRQGDSIRHGSGHGVGLTAGATSGVGLAYRKHFQNQLGVHVGGIAFGDADTLFGSLGANVMLTLSKSDAARFYVLAGAGAFYSRDEFDRENRDEIDLLVGAGIGIEISFTEELALALELPISAIFEYDDGRWDWGGVYPIPNIALVYYF